MWWNKPIVQSIQTAPRRKPTGTEGPRTMTLLTLDDKALAEKYLGLGNYVSVATGMFVQLW
jgi:hypothetical protein